MSRNCSISEDPPSPRPSPLSLGKPSSNVPHHPAHTRRDGCFSRYCFLMGCSLSQATYRNDPEVGSAPLMKWKSPLRLPLEFSSPTSGARASACGSTCHLLVGSVSTEKVVRTVRSRDDGVQESCIGILLYNLERLCDRGQITPPQQATFLTQIKSFLLCCNFENLSSICYN